MKLKIAFQMDRIESVNINEDTTFRLAEEAERRGHKLFYYNPKDLSFCEGSILCECRPLQVRRAQGDHYTLGVVQTVDLTSEVDIVWLRQDPPFNMNYITNTHLLDLLRNKTLVVNDPFWVRNYPEKLLVLRYPDLIPPTVVTKNFDVIKKFRKKFGDIIVKPMYGNGGIGVFKLSSSDPNLGALFELLENWSPEPLIIQKYLPDVVNGDKRVILVNGEPVGAINRVPLSGEIRSNMHVGGKARKVALTSRDKEICRRIGPLMREKGQLLVGLDIIGGVLTEINLTSPTGVQELERFDRINVAGKIWEALEMRYVTEFG
ncbi:MAG: glutathione synthase [Pseudomonadota bacterium]|nr:glutathione synthase [Pseudomonadota bacterium]